MHSLFYRVISFFKINLKQNKILLTFAGIIHHLIRYCISKTTLPTTCLNLFASTLAGILYRLPTRDIGLAGENLKEEREINNRKKINK
jgi:hypothetical protein